jgi:RHS repeat-associated protein
MKTVTFGGNTTTYNYNLNGSRIETIYPTGTKEQLTLDKNNRLVTLVNKKSDNTVLSNYSYSYDLAGRHTSLVDDYGTTTYEYDKTGRIINVTEQGKTTNYEYDVLGNRIYMSESFLSDQTSTYIDEETSQGYVYRNKSTQYFYSKNNKLMQYIEKMSDESDMEILEKTVNSTYDNNGNEITKYANYKIPYNSSKKRRSGSTQYGDSIDDDSDSLIEKDKYTYDGFNRLIKIDKVKDSERTVIDFEYNGSGLRTKKTVMKSGESYTPETILYTYDRQYVVLETDENNNVKNRYVKGINYIAMIDTSSNINYYIFNSHGDVAMTVNQSEEIINQYFYDIFGNISLEIVNAYNPIMYAGEFFDRESGLYYLRARYYNPYIGRFISEDSYWGEDNNPLSMNRYTYAHNNPIMFIDPSGHSVQLPHVISIAPSLIDRAEEIIDTVIDAKIGEFTTVDADGNRTVSDARGAYNKLSSINFEVRIGGDGYFEYMRYMDDDINDYFLELEAELTYRANHMRIEREIELAKQAKISIKDAKKELKDLMKNKNTRLVYTEYAQLALLALGYNLPDWGADGAYSIGGETYRALKKFQEDCLQEWEDMLNSEPGTYTMEDFEEMSYLSDIGYADGALDQTTLRALYRKSEKWAEDLKDSMKDAHHKFLYGGKDDKGNVIEGYTERLSNSLAEEIAKILGIDTGNTEKINKIAKGIRDGSIDGLLEENGYYIRDEFEDIPGYKYSKEVKQVKAIAKIYEYSTTDMGVLENAALYPENPQIYFFEGAGDGKGNLRKDSLGNPAKEHATTGRFNAMCVVVIDGKVVFLSKNASTLPDRPQGQYDSGRGHATVLPGVYNIQSGGAGGDDKWIGFNTGLVNNPTSSNSDVPAYRAYNSSGIYDPGEYTADGCDIHLGWDNYVGSSTGCFTMLKSDYREFSKKVGIYVTHPDLDEFKCKKKVIVYVNGVAETRWVNVSGFNIPDVDGIMVLDRSLADKDALMEASMYETEENVDLITQSDNIHEIVHDY